VLTCSWLAKNVCVIPDFLSAEECLDLIGASESKGYEDAPITTALGMVMQKDVRNNDRVMVDDVAAAGQLYDRAEPLLPPRLNEEWRVCGLNERLRFYRYDVGQKFDWHYDGCYEAPAGERSFLTFMIYLNQGFGGGETKFGRIGSMQRLEEALSVAPRRGMALIFEHGIPHIGSTVTSGRKYVLRTDVMYRFNRSAAAEA
jgi:2OG-Fe(II) oxygenase superfamily